MRDDVSLVDVGDVFVGTAVDDVAFAVDGSNRVVATEVVKDVIGCDANEMIGVLCS